MKWAKIQPGYWVSECGKYALRGSVHDNWQLVSCHDGDISHKGPEYKSPYKPPSDWAEILIAEDQANPGKLARLFQIKRLHEAITTLEHDIHGGLRPAIEKLEKLEILIRSLDDDQTDWHIQ